VAFKTFIFGLERPSRPKSLKFEALDGKDKEHCINRKTPTKV
jgi:hypothetical protein